MEPAPRPVLMKFIDLVNANAGEIAELLSIEHAARP